MSDSNITGVVIGLAADASIALILYYFYKRSSRAASEIQQTKLYGIDKDLIKKLEDLPDQTIQYGCLEGVTAAPKGLKSHYSDDIQGVIRNIALIEHKSKRNNGVWSDVQNVIRDVIDTVPFYLHSLVKGGSNGVKVQVTEPKNASFLLDELTTTFDNYQSNQTKDLFNRGLDRIFGEVPKGIHEYEKMLVLGTPLLAIGQIKLDNNKVILLPPENGRHYILTQKTKEEVIKHFSSQSTVIKVFLGIACVIGFGLAVYIFRKLYKNWKNRRAHERLFEEARRARQAARESARFTGGSRDTTNGSNNESPECVVCLNNPREVVLLNCGHICLCIDCVEALPQPMQCPVCRQSVERFLTTYNA